MDKKRVAKLAEEIPKLGYDLQFGVCGNQSALFTEEIAKLYNKMGVKYCGFGLESNSPAVLKYLKNGATTPADNLNAVKICRKYGLMVGSGFLVNVPNETEADRKMSEQFVLEHNLDSFGFYNTVPLPGTPLWDYALKRGIVSENMDWEKLNQFDTEEAVKLC